MKKITAILLLLTIFFACNQSKKAAESYFKVRDAFAKDIFEFAEKMKAAREEERKSMMKDMPDRMAYSDTLLHFIEGNPGEAFVADVWVEMFQLHMMSRNDSLSKVALKELSTHHVKSQYLSNIPPAFLAKSRDFNIGNFMETILKETESREVRGIFSLAYGDWLTQNPNAKQYDLKKGLALFEEVIAKHADVMAIEGPDKSLAPIGTKAESSKRRLTELAIGNRAPEIISTDLKGQEVRLSNYKGKVVMLDIWATWCGPCIKMIPDETEMVKRLENQPFELISISIDGKLETVKKFHKKTPMPWTHWFNGDKGGVLTQWNIHQYPTIILLDKDGIIRHRFNQSLEKEELNTTIDQLLAVAEE